MRGQAEREVASRGRGFRVSAGVHGSRLMGRFDAQFNIFILRGKSSNLDMLFLEQFNSDIFSGKSSKFIIILSLQLIVCI